LPDKELLLPWPSGLSGRPLESVDAVRRYLGSLREARNERRVLMTLQRPSAVALIAAAAFLVTACGGDSSPTTSPGDGTTTTTTDSVPSEETTTTTTSGGSSGGSAVATAWAEHEFPADTEGFTALINSIAPLIPDGMPIPSDGNPFPLPLSGDDFNSVESSQGQPYSCPGALMIGKPLAEGGLGGADDLTEDDLAAAEEWLETALSESGWTVDSKAPIYTPDDMAWEYGTRGTVYEVSTTSDHWVVTLTLNPPYTVNIGYCPAP